MIHHISLAAREPARVAAVLAEVMNGQSLPFPPHGGSFIVLCEDGHGTGIEVYPLASVMLPGTGDEAVQFDDSQPPAAFTATHAAISVALDEAAIKAIAAREGWRAVTCDRGGVFQVIEFWLENRMLIEFLTPEMGRSYVEGITPQKWAEYIAVDPS